MDVGRTKDVDAEVDDVTEELVGESAGDEAATWDAWDAAFDREEGPFDVAEVDLDADEVKRLDLGTLVITPFDKMNLQLQVDKAKEKVQALLISDGTSAMEVAVFAGPTRSSMLGEIREEIIKATEEADGKVELVQGPFGAELRRRLPVTTPDGKPATHLSRTWLCQGPGWVLRGVVMGKAALEPDNQDADLAMWEFFTNLVVRRGPEPAVPGSVLLMEIPQLDEK
ncbi:DUF3710 domain-containing protein [Tessaracoccus antarcticus]|uniref:DUF3710 domain-containing protein n=1 Tax=Tessaracoccus antarcticus TaxID=2479848 RepID=UPI0013142A6D|nr:DUF3710 domain-containing protein [Tessaracoccus antarcticus]